ATGCSGPDTITATATPGTTSISATATVTVQPAVIGSLQFESATPANIGIKGFGLTESSAVQFRVLDTQGNPAANQDVTFSLNSTLGGITIAPDTATSDITGLVTTFVTSGTVATSVRVTASLMSNPAVNTQSDSLVISTGIADQDSFSLSANPINVEGWDVDNSPSDILIIASDRFNNPVPDGTAIFFTAEGGQVDSSCLTQGGQCSVTWRSSSPRPSDGRVALLATAIGEETFVDLNGNNILDDTDNFDDRPEAFRDDNENGMHDAGTEEFRDFNSNNIRDAADGEYNGTLCNDANVTNVCSTSKNIFVDDSLVLVMSGSTAVLDLRDGANPATSNPVGSINAGTTVYAYISDFRGQIMPAGTMVTLSTDNGTLSTGSSFTVGNSNIPISSAASPMIYPVLITADTESSTGTLTIVVETPGGAATNFFISVSD
ncbi:MAG: Ig-like domain-containing protein, partial [Pseudomonadota bacterium]